MSSYPTTTLLLKSQALLLAIFSLCALAASTQHVQAAQLPQYFHSSGQNSPSGNMLGKNEDGNPSTWLAVHSQSNGEAIMDHLRFSGEQNANWTFLWTRKNGDTASYTLTPVFHIKKDFTGRVALEIGYDGVFDHTQVDWPSGYWVSNEDDWNSPFQPTPGEAGTYTLNKEQKSITVPATVGKVYIRLRNLKAGAGGFGLIEEGTVVFTPVSGAGTTDATNARNVRNATITAKTTYCTSKPPVGTKNIVTLGADPGGAEDSPAIIQ
jgi:hypothetical protein